MWGDRAISLHRLEQTDVLALLDNLESAELEPAVLDRVAEAAEGNPLLAEQLLAWATEGGSLDVLPPSVERNTWCESVPSSVLVARKTSSRLAPASHGRSPLWQFAVPRSNVLPPSPEENSASLARLIPVL